MADDRYTYIRVRRADKERLDALRQDQCRSVIDMFAYLVGKEAESAPPKTRKPKQRKAG